MDATSDRDFALEFAQVAATLGLHLSRFAEEVTLHATAEFGFIDLPEAFSTGSSAMPQKKNPDLTELLRGKSGRLLGAATMLATVVKGLPLAYNKDLQESQEACFEVSDTLEGMLPLLPLFTAALALPIRADAAGGGGRLPKRDGGCDVPGASGHSVSHGARDHRQGGPVWVGERDGS